MIRIVRTLGVALAIFSPVVASAQSKAPHPRAEYVVAPPQPNAPKPTDVLTGQVIYLNNCSTGCTVTPGNEDASTMTSEIASKVANWSEFAWQPGEWEAVVECVKEVYSPYNVVVTDQLPQSAYNMEIIAGDPKDIGLDSGVGGIALVSGDCSARQNSIAFAFTSAIDVFAQEDAGNRVWGMCWTASQEIAHIYGLDHEYAYLDDMSSACNDPMTYRDDCGGQKFFRNRAANCGEFGPARPGCGPGNNCATAQNSHLKLLGLFGPGTPLTTPPVVTITNPAGGGTIANGATLIISATAQRGIAKLELYINGYKWGEVKGHGFIGNGQDNSPYTITLPGSVPDGVMDIVVKGYDDIGVETDSATVTVTKGAPCADESSCAKGQNCSAGKCFWDAATGVLGDACTYPQFCTSGLCQGTSDSQICTQTCVVGSTGACPMGFDCVMTNGNDGICFTQDSGGCCNVGSESHAVYAHAFLALAVLGFMVRRRRR